MQWQRASIAQASPYPSHRPPPRFTPPSQLDMFGTVPAEGPFTEERGGTSSHGQQEVVFEQRQRTTASSPANWRSSVAPGPEIRTADWRPSCDTAQDDQRHEENRKRSREYERPYLKEMAAAHAQNREPNIVIPVSSSGTVLGLKSSWHRAARLVARQTINYRVRSYKARRAYWESQVQCVAEKLAQKFTYSRPLDIRYLGKFLKNTLKNDRKIWKAYFIEYGLRHVKCPEEAFTEWKRYWVSSAGREESLQMTEMRKGKNKTQRTSHAAPLANQFDNADPLYNQVRLRTFFETFRQHLALLNLYAVNEYHCMSSMQIS